jgi:hypothetical protein
MEKIIKELESKKEFELQQIGMTPTTDFDGTQAEHDKLHANNACEYQRAIDILKMECCNPIKIGIVGHISPSPALWWR